MNTAWWVVCVATEKPDGPGLVIGPFPNRDLAEMECRGEAEGGACCDNSHIIVHGPGREGANIGLTEAASLALDYWAAHPDELPECNRQLILELCHGTHRIELRELGNERVPV